MRIEKINVESRSTTIESPSNLPVSSGTSPEKATEIKVTDRRRFPDLQAVMTESARIYRRHYMDMTEDEIDALINDAPGG